MIKTDLANANQALPGRKTPMQVSGKHFVLGSRTLPPFPSHLEMALFGLGCFWGAERIFWNSHGVISTAAGYAGGSTQNPTYDEICSGLTGHNEVVQVIFDPEITDFYQLIIIFWESHNPTQGMRQGNDIGTQYRSSIYTYNALQRNIAEQTKEQYQQKLSKAGLATITTEIMPAPVFYYAEEYHQQYLAKNPSGYCGLGGTGISIG